MTVCKTCGKENQEHYKFCLGCGMEIGSPIPVAASTVTDGRPPVMPPEPEPPPPMPPPRAVAPKLPAVARTAPGPAPQRVVAPPASNGGGSFTDESTSLGIGKYMQMLNEDDTAPKGMTPAAAPDSHPICPSCGADATGFVFCGQCGARVAPAPSAKPTARPQLAPTPAKAARGKLVLIRPDGSEGGTHPLNDGSNIIGRTVSALFEADNYLSPRHAELNLGPSGLVMHDLESLNGVFVKLSDEEEIIDKDVFRIGQELMRFDVIHPPEPLEDGTEVMGSPNPGYWGRVALIIGKDMDGSAFPLFGDAVMLGRERGDILFPEDGYVSGTHARLSIRGERFYLADMNSSNGTFLRTRTDRAIRSGTFVLMGQQLFRVQYA